MNALTPLRPAVEPEPRITRPPPRRAVSFRLASMVLGAAVLLAAAAHLGAQWWQVGRFVESTDDAYVGGDVTAISPHVGGYLSDILVADNAPVQAGQLLARIDARDAQAAFDRAQAALAAQSAALQGLRAQRLVQQASIRGSAAELDARTAHAAFTLVDGARYATLSVTRAGSLQDAQRASSINHEARASLTAAQAALAAARAQLDVLDAQITQAQAGIEQGEAELRRARLDLGYTEIRSPIDGFVGNRAARTGNFVAPGAYLLSVIPAGGLWVDANFKEDQLAAMRPGQPVTLLADAAPGRIFHGRVLSLAPGTGAVFSVIPPENATGNFTKIVQRVPVRIALDAPDAVLDRLRPGLSVTARVDTRPVP